MCWSTRWSDIPLALVGSPIEEVNACPGTSNPTPPHPPPSPSPPSHDSAWSRYRACHTFYIVLRPWFGDGDRDRGGCGDDGGDDNTATDTVKVVFHRARE